MKQILFIVLLLLISNVANAGKEHEISQNDIKFSVPIKVIKPGDTLKFTNKDKVAHNIISLTNDFQFDLGAVKPGDSKSVRFNSVGVVDIECTIHSGMKMTLFVFE